MNDRALEKCKIEKRCILQYHRMNLRVGMDTLQPNQKEIVITLIYSRITVCQLEDYLNMISLSPNTILVTVVRPILPGCHFKFEQQWDLITTV